MPERTNPTDPEIPIEGPTTRPAEVPRTILVNASYGPSLIRFRGKLIQALVGRGHQVHVSAPDIDRDLAQAIRQLGAHPHDVPLVRTGLSPFKDFRYFRSIRRLLREVGAELSFSYTIKPNIWGSLAAASLGIRSASMVTGLGYSFGDARGFRTKAVQLVARRLYRAATNANDVVIFQNPDDRDEFLESGSLASATKARLVNGSGVDLDYYRPAPLPEQPVFLMLARLIGAKGVREYAAAAARVTAHGGNAHFLLAGFLDDGPDRIDAAELQDWQALGVEYLGHLEDVRPAIARASVYVLPSYYREGTPRSILEAMAMGRPIITTDMPGCRETVDHGVTGLLVPPRDPAALADAMQGLADDPERRERMGQASLALCRAKYDVDRVNQVMMQHLSLAEGHRMRETGRE